MPQSTGRARERKRTKTKSWVFGVYLFDRSSLGSKLFSSIPRRGSDQRAHGTSVTVVAAAAAVGVANRQCRGGVWCVTYVSRVTDRFSLHPGGPRPNAVRHKKKEWVWNKVWVWVVIGDGNK